MIKSKRYIVNGLILILVFSTFLFYGFQTGITGRTSKNGSGCTCHSETSSSSVSVVIAGPDNLSVNETANYTVTITGGPLVAGGTNIAASSGVLNPLEGLKKADNELTHVSPKSSSSGSVVFNFTFTAPGTAGEVTLFAAGNSVNQNGANTGDAWNFAANKTIAVDVSTGIDNNNVISSFNLEQNYPNPFNPATTIVYEIPASVSGQQTVLKVFDLSGREVAELVNEIKTAGRYSINFNASGLSSGVYIYQLKAGNYSITKKMSLLK